MSEIKKNRTWQNLIYFQIRNVYEHEPKSAPRLVELLKTSSTLILGSIPIRKKTELDGKVQEFNYLFYSYIKLCLFESSSEIRI